MKGTFSQKKDGKKAKLWIVTVLGVTTELTAGLEELARESLNPKSDPVDNRKKWMKVNKDVFLSLIEL